MLVSVNILIEASVLQLSQLIDINRGGHFLICPCPPRLINFVRRSHNRLG